MQKIPSVSQAASPLPHRFREESFRKYEPIITASVNSLPNSMTWQLLPGQSSETLTCRLRDAMRSLFENKWDTSVDMRKFEGWYGRIVVSQNASGQVTVGAKQSTAAPAKLAATSNAIVSIQTDTTEIPVIRALCLLLDRKIISPVVVTNTAIRYVAEEAQQSGLDIEIVDHSNGFLII